MTTRSAVTWIAWRSALVMSHHVIRLRISRKILIDVEKSVLGNITRVPVWLLVSSAIMLMVNNEQAVGNCIGGVGTFCREKLRYAARETHVVNTDAVIGSRIGAVAMRCLTLVAGAGMTTDGLLAAVVILVCG